MLQQYGDGDEGADGDDGGDDDDDDDDPDEVQLMVVLMAMISPLREGIPPAEICLPERSFSLGVFRPAEAEESFCVAPRVLGFWKDNIRQMGEPGVARVATPPAGVA